MALSKNQAVKLSNEIVCSLPEKVRGIREAINHLVRMRENAKIQELVLLFDNLSNTQKTANRNCWLNRHPACAAFRLPWL